MTAGACNPFEVEPTCSHELPKPECRSIAQLTLGGASRSVGFGRIETDKPKGLVGNPNRVAVQHLDLAGIKWRSIRNRGDKGENKGHTANYCQQFGLHSPSR